MINVIQWKKQLLRDKCARFLENQLHLPSGALICASKLKTPGEPVFNGPVELTYDEYRLKYTKLFNRKLP